MLDWEDFHSFLAIARHGTLSAAARANGVRQTTMGRRLAALEARAGVVLLQKTPRGYVITPAGAAARRAAQRMAAAARAAARAITGRDSGLAGEIRLTSVESLGAAILVPILARFARSHPGIQVRLVTDTRTLSLAAREADLAVRLARPRGGDLLMRKAASLSFGFHASAEYLARFGAPAGTGQGHRLILMEEDAPVFPEIAALAQHFPGAEPALRSNSRYVHLAACAAGMGIACLARYLAAGQGLARLAGTAPARDIWLVQHRDTRHTPRIRALADALADGLREAAPRLAGEETAVSAPGTAAGASR